jgi:DNA mismatch repair protein MutH
MAILAAVASEKNSLHGNRLSVGAERILGEPTLFSPNLEDQVWLLDQYLEFIDALIERSWISTELWDYARKRALK